MNTQPILPSGIPRKELTSSVQKSAVFLLFVLLVAFAGLYVLMNMNLEKQNIKQKHLNDFISLVHSAEEKWLEWLLIDDKREYGVEKNGQEPEQLQGILSEEYKLIEQSLGHYASLSMIDVSQSTALLSRVTQESLNDVSLTRDDRVAVYASLEVLEQLEEHLLSLKVAADYERDLFLQQLMWGPIAISLFIALFIIVMVAKFNRRLSSGFSNLHYILDHHEHCHVTNIPVRNQVDEFTDLEHLIDNELASQYFDLKAQDKKLKLITLALSKVEDPFFVIDREGDIAWLSAGAERLWRDNTAILESTFQIDAGLDSPIGESVADVLLTSKESVDLKLSDGVYALSVHRFESESECVEGVSDAVQYLVSLSLKSELAELQVLHNSLKLMAQDVWDIPVRLLRMDSPYASFAVSLEIIRRRVVDLLEVTSSAADQTNTFEKITKLQQIASLIDKETNNNGLVTSETDRSTDSLLHHSEDDNQKVASQEIAQNGEVNSLEIEGIQIELNDMAWLSEQVRDSLILGYELVLQRLSLVEKDLSSDVFLLADVDRCLNEVRAGVLTSLSATEGEAENIRRRFAVDLEHDISLVQNQMEGMKTMAASTLSLLEADRSVGVARLDRARESINEIVEKIHGLMAKTASFDTPENKLIEQSSDNDWDKL